MLLPIEQVKSPLTIKVALDRAAKLGFELTPDAMIDILKCTNHKVSIRDVLKMVPEGKEADFKEAICSAVEHREHTDANLERMREIAKIGGFEAEFEEAHVKEKLIGNTFEKTFIAKSNEDLENNPDLSGYETVICDFEGKTEFADLTKLPKKMIIKGDLNLSGYKFEQLPDLSNVVVKGDFYCIRCENLTSLEGAPKEVGGSFDCHDCKKLTSLNGAPKEVGGDFNCGECSKLESLKGAPKEVYGSFDCRWCDNLTSLEGAPKEVGGDFNCCCCENLTSLEGAPEQVGGNFYCIKTNITSLEGAPKEVGGSFWCSSSTKITSLEGAPKEVGGDFFCEECNGLTSAKGLPMHIGGKIKCDDGFRSEIDKELEKREKDKDKNKNKNKKESPNIASNIFSRMFGRGK